MKEKDRNVGQHVWIKESDCCGGYHQKGEEGIIISAGTPDSFLVESIKTGQKYWHGLKCVITIEDLEFLSDKDFEI